MNVGLAAVPTPLSEVDLPNFQGIGLIPGVNNPNKGYNEFVLYGEDIVSNETDVTIDLSLYWFYVGLSFNNV